MKISRQTKLAYAAGIIDGEGCISIYRCRVFGNGIYGGKIKNYRMKVIVTQKDGKIVDWLVGNFGGAIYLHWKGTKTGYSHEWVISHQKASTFLKQILPFLIYKKPQAEIAIRFQERIKYGVELNEHELLERDNLCEEIGKLKTISTYSKQPNIQRRVNNAALTTKRENALNGDAIV
jgi:hypothetical protein